MKVVICGGRDYSFSSADYERLNALHEQHHFTQVISGGARGADRCGEIWARLNAIPLHVEKAEWEKYGASAGPIRNAVMVMLADAFVSFPGGRGTADMVFKAKNAGLLVFEP